MNHLSWVIVFVTVAVIAALLGFHDVAETAAGLAVAFLIAFFVLLAAMWMTNPRYDSDSKNRRW